MVLQEIPFGFDYPRKPNGRECATGTAKDKTTKLTWCPSRSNASLSRPAETITERLPECSPKTPWSQSFPLSPALASHGVSSHQAARCSCEPLYGEATNWYVRSTGQWQRALRDVFDLASLK